MSSVLTADWVDRGDRTTEAVGIGVDAFLFCCNVDVLMEVSDVVIVVTGAGVNFPPRTTAGGGLRSDDNVASTTFLPTFSTCFIQLGCITIIPSLSSLDTELPLDDGSDVLSPLDESGAVGPRLVVVVLVPEDGAMENLLIQSGLFPPISGPEVP